MLHSMMQHAHLGWLLIGSPLQRHTCRAHARYELHVTIIASFDVSLARRQDSTATSALSSNMVNAKRLRACA